MSYYKISILASIFVVFFLVSFYGLVQLPHVSILTNYANDRYTPQPVRSGKAVELIYIGSPNCFYSTNSITDDLVVGAKSEVNAIVREKGFNFYTSAIIIDNDPINGTKHANEMGNFNEIISGKNWYNIGAEKYLWSGMSLKKATPQVVVIEYRVEIGEESRVFNIRDRTLVLQKAGLDEIKSWRESGYSLPSGLLSVTM